MSQGMNWVVSQLIALRHKHSFTYNPRVPSRWYSGVLRPKDLDDARETEVYAGREECRSNCEADDLHKESGLGPLVAIRQNAADVACHLGDEAQ